MNYVVRGLLCGTSALRSLAERRIGEGEDGLFDVAVCCCWIGNVKLWLG
jgi:hypothetical protein